MLSEQFSMQAQKKIAFCVLFFRSAVLQFLNALHIILRIITVHSITHYCSTQYYIFLRNSLLCRMIWHLYWRYLQAETYIYHSITVYSYLYRQNWIFFDWKYHLVAFFVTYIFLNAWKKKSLNSRSGSNLKLFHGLKIPIYF